MKPTTSTLVGALKHPAVWISVAFLGLVVMEAYFWVADRMTIPVGITGSVLYPVLLAALAYVLVFHRTDHYRNFKAFVTACCFGVGVVTLFLLSRRPMLFDAMSNEDGFVETLSAAALFVGAAAFVAVMVGQLRRRRVLVAVVSGLFAVVLFVIGMEEISWMQRILGFETTDYFIERNIQNEINLHNFNTGVSEKIFYFGGFIALILLPYFQKPLTAFLAKLKQEELATLLPAQWLLLPSSVMVGYVGTSVTKDPTAGIAALVTAFILFRLAVGSLDAGHFPKFMVYGAFLVLVGVMVYYVTTYNYASVEGLRSWARKEYLELIIAVGLMGYAVSTLQQSKALDAARETARA